MSNISLNKATRTCKVNVGWAPRIASDRFENSNLMMCPVWNNVDNAGRQVCVDSFYTKRAGCNSSLDRINVENDLRPQYMEYITLDACGIDGDMYDCRGSGNPEQIGVTQSFVEGYQNLGARENYRPASQWGNSKAVIRSQPPRRENYAPTVPGYMPYNGPYDDAIIGCDSLSQISKYTGQFGQRNFRADINPTCNNYSYEQAMAEMSQANSEASMINHAARYGGLRSCGM